MYFSRCRITHAPHCFSLVLLIKSAQLFKTKKSVRKTIRLPSMTPCVVIKFNCNYLIHNFLDYHLKDFMYFEKDVGRELECSHLCVAQNGKCRSVNVAKKTNKSQKRVKCQLNNETKEINTESFVPDPSFNYYEPNYVGSNL